MAEIIWANGSREPAKPASKKSGYSLKYVQDIVGGYAQAIRLSPKEIMLVNEEGRLKRLPVNEVATSLVQQMTQSGDIICGDVLVCGTHEFK